jgi:hypothetical protein
MDDSERFDGIDLSLYPQLEGLLFAELEIDSEKEKEKVWYSRDAASLQRPDAKGKGIELPEQPPPGKSLLLRTPFRTGPAAS